MKSKSNKEQKKEEEQLQKAKELKEKIESLKSDLISKTKIIKNLQEQRENQIEIIKKLDVENKVNQDNFVIEYKKILTQYKNIEKDMYEIMNDLKSLSEISFNKILELRKEKETICKNKNLIIEEKKKEYVWRIQEVQLETVKHTKMIQQLLSKLKEILSKTHIEYENDKELKPLLIRLQKIGEETNIQTQNF